MIVGPTDSPIAGARLSADAELKKALSVLDPSDFSSNAPAFRAFTASMKLLFNEEAAGLLHTCSDLATFERDVRRLREQIIDEYTKAPLRQNITKRQRRRLERPIPLDQELRVVPVDKWDRFAPTSLLPNKKDGIRKELKRVLGEQLPYWLREAARQFDRKGPAGDPRPSNESARTPSTKEISVTVVFSSSRRVTIVRAAGTPEELRWDTEIGGDFDAKALFQAPDRVLTGDEIHCDIFDRPRIVARVKPKLLADGEVAYWEAAITPRLERSQLAHVSVNAPPKLVEQQRPDFPDPFQPDANDRPLGDNPFPPGHQGHEAFEESKRGPAKTATENHGTEESTKRRGRRRDQQRRDAIQSAIAKYGDDWRDRLSEIFQELDRNEVPLGDFQGRKIDLGDGDTTKVWKWDDLDLTHGEQRKQVIDALRKYAD